MTQNERGMTLIELVVVALLLSVLAAILYGTLNGISRARDATEHSSTSDVVAHQILARMLSELESRSFVPLNSNADGDSKNEDLDSFASVGGASLYLLGLDKKKGDADADEIRFVSASAAQPLIGSPSNHGLLEVKYHLAEDPNKPRGDSPVYTLVREESPAAVSTKDVSNKRRIVLPVAENVSALNFRYLKNGTWQNEWKESTPPLPEAVEITLELNNPEVGSSWYRTAVPISAKQKNQNHQP